MAGSYTDIPGTRFDLSKDGSLLFATSDSVSTPAYFTNTQVAAVMDLDPVQNLASYHSNQYGTSYLTILFPEARKITGLYWQTDNTNGNTAAAPRAYYSLDSTDGLNGTFSQWPGTGGGRAAGAGSPLPYYRNSILGLSQDGVRAIRLTSNDLAGYSNVSMSFRTLHVYGVRSTSQVDRLAFWHPTLDQELTGSYFDFGDLPRGTVGGSRAFRIRNLSATKAASALQLTATSLTGSAMPLPGVQLSTDQANWTVTTSPVNLAAASTSLLYYAQLNMTGEPTAVPLPRSARITTIMGSYA